MSKLAITGITGKNGKYLFQEILDNDNIIKTMFNDGIKFCVRDLNKVSFIRESGISIKYEFIKGDTSNIFVTDELLKDCSTVLHIAGIHTSLNIIRSAVKQNVKRVILVHTTGIYSKYKEAGEEYRRIDKEVYQLAQNNDINLTILRPTMIYGTTTDRNISVFIKMVDKLPIMPVVNGAHYELQPVHCEDLGKAFYQVLINPNICDNHDYILSGGAPIELKEIFVQIAKNLGVERRFTSCPFSIAYSGAWLIYILTLTRLDFRERVQRLCEPRVFSHDKAKKDFGYSPRTFQEGIVKEVKDYLNEKR